MTTNAEHIVNYLARQLPDDLTDIISFSTVARRAEQEKVIIVTANPSVPDIRRAGDIAINNRHFICDIAIAWSTGPLEGSGQNYAKLDRLGELIINAICDMINHNNVFGPNSTVIAARIEPDDAQIRLNEEADTFILTIMVKFQISTTPTRT